MKNIVGIVLVLVTANTLPAQAESEYKTISSISAITDKLFPSVELGPPPDGVARSPFSAPLTIDPEISAINDFGPSLILHFKYNYSLGGTPGQSEFDLLLYGFQPTLTAASVKQGDVIGKTDGTGMKLAVLSKTVDKFLVMSSRPKPVFFKNRHWYSPAFLFPSGSTNYLSFAYVDDIMSKLSGVAEEAKESPGFVLYPDFKVRFKTTLLEYPRPLTDEETQSLRGYEQPLFGKTGLFFWGSDVTVGDNHYVMCWQKGFDGYLKEEYRLGNDIWVFGAIATYDAFRDVGYLFVRDFSLDSVETMLEKRLSALR